MTSAKSPPRARRRRRFFLDTSAVYYQLFGHRLQVASVADAIGDGWVEIPGFVRMEFLRGIIVNLLKLYFVIKEEVISGGTVRDALHEWGQVVRQDRKLKTYMQTQELWLLGHEDWNDPDRSLPRLGNAIIRLVAAFDAEFSSHSKDELRCELGKIGFPDRPYSEDLLLDFHDRFRSIAAGVPACDLCGFRARQEQSLLNRGIDLHSPEQRTRHAHNKGYVGQAERLETEFARERRQPACAICARLGDTIIALLAPEPAVIVTADRSFEAFGQILGIDVKLLPSLAQLKSCLLHESGEQ